MPCQLSANESACGNELFNRGIALFGVNINTTVSWNLYIAGEKLIVPTSAKAEAGFGIEVEPVFVALLADAACCSDAIAQTLERGNPSVPTPNWKTAPSPVVLRHAGVKSWSAFLRKARGWVVKKQPGSFLVAPLRKVHLGGRAWLQEDREHGETITDHGGVSAVSVRIFQVISSSL
jgi:hypothetical protein